MLGAMRSCSSTSARRAPRRGALTVVLALVASLVLSLTAQAALENRTTITWPNHTATQISQLPIVINNSNGENDASAPAGNSWQITHGAAADQAFGYVNTPLNLVANDFAITYVVKAPPDSTDALARDLGTAFVLSADAPSYLPRQDSDYERLGIYGNGTTTAVAITHAVAVELDNNTRGDNRDPGLPTGQSHVAITTPSDGPVTHQAISTLTTPYANNTSNTLRVSWQLVSSTDPAAVTDNVYRLSYSYWQGSAQAIGAPTVTGSQDYTYAQMVTLFGDPTRVYAAFSASTGSLISRNQYLSLPLVYTYTDNYYVMRADGTKTTIPVPGLAPKTGSLPAGPGDVGPLPAAPAGYTLAPSQTTAVTISTTAASNVFNFYYVDAAPVITAPAVTLERGSTFTPMTGVSATDVVDGNLTAKVTSSGTVDTAVAGTYTVTYSVTDSVGNVTTVQRTVTVVDTTPPAAPTISPITDGGTTVRGTGEPGATVTVTLPGGSTRTATVAADGSWSITSPTPLVGGQTVTAVQTDTSGNTSPQATATVPDQTAPAAPVISPLTDGGTTVRGTGEPGATVTVTLPGGATRTATVAPDGSWSVTAPAPLVAGQTVSATQADAAGNTSPSATATVPDQTAPAAPTIKPLTDGATTVSGKAEAGSTVKVTLGDGTVLTTQAAADGTWSVTPATPLAGPQTISATATDAAGNVSPTTTAGVPDTTKPSAPTISPITDGGTTVSGTGEPGATVSVTLPDGSTQTATVAPGGTWTVTSPTPLTGGQTVTATQKDPSGNVSDPTSAVVPDQTAPSAPTIGTIAEATTTVTGTGEPGATVTVTLPGGTTRTATVAPDGTWSVTSPQPLLGNEQVTAVQRDAAGNTSPSVTATVPVEMLSIKATKVWDEQRSATHPTITFQLRRDGVVYATQDLPAGTTTTTFPDVRRYDPMTGAEYAWTLTEVPVTGYTTTVAGSAAAGFTVTNHQANAPVTLTATGTGGTPVPGVVYVLRDSSGTEVARATTGADGTLTFPDVPAGTYSVTAVAVPDGYRLPTGPLSVTVTDGTPQALTTTVYATAESMPATGTLGPLPYWAVGALLLSVGLASCRRRALRS